MKLRILSVDLKLDNDQITNESFLEAPSFHDFDIVVIDPLGVANFLNNQDHKYKDGFLTLDYDSKGTNKWIRNAISERRRETKHFLSRGRLLVCILRRPNSAYLCSFRDEWPKPNEEENWVNTYDWLPLRYSSDSMISILTPAQGNRISLRDSKHPFAPYFSDFNKQIYYEAYLDENKKPHYFENFYTIAETHGQFPVAFSFELEGGQVVFLPPIENPDPKKLAGVLLNCILANSGRIEESAPPSWLRHYSASVPGLADLEHQEKTLTEQLQRLGKQLDNIQQQKAEREKYLKLLYEQGKFQLEPVVRGAFSLLGFTVKEAEPSDGLLESDEGVALLEIEGKDDKAINIDKYSKLLNYVINDEAQTGTKRKKGILVGNGFRLNDPKDRRQQFTREVIGAAKSIGFCLLSTQIMFDLVCKVLDDPDNDDLKRQIRQQLLATDGVFMEVNNG
ncbi:hypothetical protein ACFLTN_07520 [Chloroflexota bacterium]